MLPHAAYREGVEPGAVESNVQRMRLPESSDVALLLFSQADPDQILAVDRKVVIDGEPAPGAER